MLDEFARRSQQNKTKQNKTKQNIMFLLALLRRLVDHIRVWNTARSPTLSGIDNAQLSGSVR
jgi:hypothetical protein